MAFDPLTGLFGASVVVCGNFSFDYFIVFMLGKCCEVWKDAQLHEIEWLEREKQ